MLVLIIIKKLYAEKYKLKHNKKQPNDSILQDLLSKYPSFFSQNSNSIHYKYHNTLASILNILKHDTEIIRLTRALKRPLKIWRIQTQPHENIICYNITINNIKHISLYQEEKNKQDTLLTEHSFQEGINEYSNYLELTSTEIIPKERYYIEVETRSGLIFQKGFPENDTPQGDIYDHDNALDTIGYLYNLKRRKYHPNIPEADYPYTHPLFCNSQTEWDYYYETRLKNHIRNFGKQPLHLLILESIFEITPQVTGRWRQIARMNQDNMDTPLKAKNMASKNHNSNVYDIKYKLSDLPRNLKLPSAEDIKNILEEIFPIGAKIYFQIQEEKTLTDTIKIQDKIQLNINIQDHIKPIDNFKPEKIEYDIGY